MANRRRVGVAWHKDPELLERMRRVEPLHIRRISNRQIALQLGVSEHVIREDVKRLQLLWRARIQGEQEHLRAQVVAELDDVAERALAAAEWDQQAEQAVLYGVEVEIDGQPRQVYRDVKGAAQFRGQKAAALGVVRAARMDKAKVLGIVVEKAALTDADGASLDFVALARQLHGSD